METVWMKTLESDFGGDRAKFTNQVIKTFFDEYRILYIEGNIGVGKSTLSKDIQAHCAAIDEESKPDLYEERGFEYWLKHLDTHVFAFQVSMMYNCATNMMAAFTSQRPAIMDRTIHGNEVFTRMNILSKRISKLEAGLFYKSRNDWFERWIPSFHENGLYVYIHSSAETCHGRMMQRGRAGEMSNTVAYLETIEAGYIAQIIFLAISGKSILPCVVNYDNFAYSPETKNIDNEETNVSYVFSCIHKHISTFKLATISPKISCGDETELYAYIEKSVMKLSPEKRREGLLMFDPWTREKNNNNVDIAFMF
jgi:deoxyadenosine/deoxycytidine kinase